MKKKGQRRKQIKKKLLNKYRFVVLQEDTFEERFSFKLNRLNVFVFGTIFAFFLIGLTSLIIAFTPLREYIPGYSSTKLKRQATNMLYKTDSLQNIINTNEHYISSIRKVLTGDVKRVEFNRDSVIEAAITDSIKIDLAPSKQDSLLREQVEQEDKYNLLELRSSLSDVLFAPVTGQISEGYNPEKKHYAVDVVVTKDAPIKAVAEGTVIFAEWTAETGHVIIIEHRNDLLSVYKHNASLNKEQGDLVKAG
ncbi:MAG: M23 family metallopeptidase, partial [Flavobacteriaceae bacterium]|nr:M23 family metallopeptidase [Flavobacteriaceae bacterium]